MLGLGVCSFLSLPDSVEEDVDQDDEEGKDETEEKPNIHYLDGGGGGEAVGHRDVEGGEDHHAGDVHRDDGLQELGVGQVVGGLVDNVHEYGGQVGHNEDAWKISDQLDLHPDQLGAIVGVEDVVTDIVNVVLTNTAWTAVLHTSNYLRPEILDLKKKPARDEINQSWCCSTIQDVHVADFFVEGIKVNIPEGANKFNLIVMDDRHGVL